MKLDGKWPGPYSAMSHAHLLCWIYPNVSARMACAAARVAHCISIAEQAAPRGSPQGRHRMAFWDVSRMRSSQPVMQNQREAQCKRSPPALPPLV